MRGRALIVAPSRGARSRRSIRTSPTMTTICSSDHPEGRALSVTSPKRENTAGLAEGPLDLRERLTQSHPADEPRTMIARNTQSAGLGEKLTSPCIPWSSSIEKALMPLGGVLALDT